MIRHGAQFCLLIFITLNLTRGSLIRGNRDSVLTSPAENRVWASLGWERTKWDEYLVCRALKVCSSEDENCEGGVRWMKMTQELQVSEKVVVVNMFYDTALTLESYQVDVKRYKKEICHLAFVGLSKDSCVKFFTQNWCPWVKTSEEHLPIWATNISCETKTLNTPGFDVSPFCYDGPGWKGTLETALEEGVHQISWESLVKQPHCGGMVFVRDEITGLQKGFWTTFTEVYFPIENVESTCNLTIKIHYPFHRQNVWKCFTVSAKIGCKDEVMSTNISHNNMSKNDISHNISHIDSGRN